MYYNRHFTPKVTKYLWLLQDEEDTLESVLPACIADKSDETGLRQVALGRFRLGSAEEKHLLIACSQVSGHTVFIWYTSRLSTATASLRPDSWHPGPLG